LDVYSKLSWREIMNPEEKQKICKTDLSTEWTGRHRPYRNKFWKRWENKLARRLRKMYNG